MDAPIHRILTPTDFSPDAEQAIRVASELSRAYSAPLTIIYVYDPVAYPFPESYVPYTTAQFCRLWDDLERRLTRAAADARAAGAVQPKWQLLEGLTAAEIVDFAKREGCDLVVMGTHGRTGVARFLLGSVAARVVQTAECAVLTVRRPGLVRETAPREVSAAC